jgi:hypothetical protein
MPMAGKRGWLWAVVFGLGLLAPSPAQAGPFFGEWSWFWHPAPDCPRGQYSHLHYWAPEIYYVRKHLHPSNLNQYPPGPCPPVPPSYIFNPYPCRTLPPMPSVPYADPASYYGRPLVRQQ